MESPCHGKLNTSNVSKCLRSGNYQNRKYVFCKPKDTLYLRLYLLIEQMNAKTPELPTKKVVNAFAGVSEGSFGDYYSTFKHNDIIRYERKGKKTFIRPITNNFLQKWVEQNGGLEHQIMTIKAPKGSFFDMIRKVNIWKQLTTETATA